MVMREPRRSRDLFIAPKIPDAANLLLLPLQCYNKYVKRSQVGGNTRRPINIWDIAVPETSVPGAGYVCSHRTGADPCTGEPKLGLHIYQIESRPKYYVHYCLRETHTLTRYHCYILAFMVR